MAYLWGKYERKANYRTEKRLASKPYDTRTTLSFPRLGDNPRLFPSGERKDCYELSEGDLIYTDGASFPIFSKGDVVVAKIIRRIGTGRTIDFFVDFYKIEEIREVTEYSRGSYITDVKSTSRNAYPDNGEKDGYFYVYKGIDNQAPSISGYDEDLGNKTTPFTKSFEVNDSDNGQELTVTVKLNYETINTIKNASRGQSYTVDINKERFDRLQVGYVNTIEITVSDTEGSSAVRRWKFKRTNSNPVVQVENSNMGEQNKPFSFSFTPNDVDGDEITGKVFLDEVQIEDLGTLTRGQSKKVTINKLDYAVLKNGDHRIRIEVTDSKGAKGYGHIDFSKNLTYCWYEFKKDIEAMATSIIVNPSVKLASGAKMTVKVCNNAKDREPAWETMPSEQVGKAYSFRNKNKTADTWSIGVNIRIDRSKAKEDSYFYGFVGNYQ